MHRVVANGLEGPCVFRPVLLDRHAVTDNEIFPFPIDAAVQLTANVLDRLGIVIGSPHTARGGDDLRRMICEERDADAIVPEVLLAPRALDRAMLPMLAPADERLIALPPRVRQEDIRSVHAGVSIDKENTTAPLQLRLQSRREFEAACRVAIKRGSPRRTIRSCFFSTCRTCWKRHRCDRPALADVGVFGSKHSESRLGD